MNWVVVFGGTGFLGSEIVSRLASEGVLVRVAVRNPQNFRINETSGQIRTRIETVRADVRDEASVGRALEGSDAAINAVALYTESGSETFEAVHECGAANVAEQCAARNVGQLLHISGIGVDVASRSTYVRARVKGELLVRQAFPDTTIFRPSVLFGPRDTLINTLADIIGRSPVFPLFGRGRTKLQPVYVGDVAKAATRALQDPLSRARTFELGGPRVYTYRELAERVADHINKGPLYLPLPFILWAVMARIASLLPAQPLTRDQVELMRADNVVARGALSLDDLGMTATALDEVLPQYAL